MPYNIDEYSIAGDERQPGHAAWIIARANVDGAAQSNWGGGPALFQARKHA
jgi:hypothetical protein